MIYSQAMKAKLLALALSALAAAASAAGVWYVAPDGTGDGSSWDSPASFAAAYAAAGTANGGELWLKKGFHVLTATVTLKSGVVVRGGFEGTETLASQAKPKVNVTAITGDVNLDNMYRPDGTTTEAKYVSVYDGAGGYTDVNPNRANAFWSPGRESSSQAVSYVTDDLLVGFSAAASSVVYGAEFHGITFSGFGNCAFSVTQGSVGAFVLEGCDFVANNTQFANQAAVYLSTASGEITDCTFIANRRALVVSGGTLTFARCTVRDTPVNGDANTCTSAVLVNGSSKAVFIECLFTRNHDYTRQSYQNASCVFHSGGTLTYRRCSFTGNTGYEYGNGSRGNCRGIIYQNGGTAYVRESSFTKNMTDQSGQPSALVYMHAGGTPLIESCYVADNVLTNRSSANVMTVFMAHECGAGANSQVANTTVERNYAIAMNGGGVGMVANRVSYTNHALANCLFADNVLEKGSDSTATEIAEYVCTLTSAGNTHAVFFNTIMTGNGTDGHKAFSVQSGSNVRLCFYNSVFYNYPEQALTDINESWINNTETNAEGHVCITKTDPRVMPRSGTDGTGLRMRGIDASSPYYQKGRDVWRATGGHWLYYYPSENGGASYYQYHYVNHNGDIKAADALAMGVSKDYPCVSDAYGRVQPTGGVSPGPLIPTSGFVITFR